MSEGLNDLLFNAAKAGDWDDCLRQIDAGASIDAKDNFKRTPLGWAARCGHTLICLGLLDRGADIESRADFNKTPLILAAYDGHTQTCLALLDRGADINAKSGQDRTTLELAAYNGQTQTCLALLARGASLLGFTETTGDWPRLSKLTPLQAAAELDDISEMERVLRAEPKEGLEERLTSAIELAAQTRTQPGPAVLKGWLDARRAMTAIDALIGGEARVQTSGGCRPTGAKA